MFFTPEEKADMKRSMAEIWAKHSDLYTGKIAIELNNLPTKDEQKELKERRKLLKATKKISAKTVPTQIMPITTEPVLPVAEATDPVIIVTTPTTDRFYDTMLSRVTKKTSKGLPYNVCPAYNKCWFKAIDQLVSDGLVTKKENGYYLIQKG